MANLQAQFNKFHNTIKIDFDDNKLLRDKRDLIIGNLRDGLRKLFSIHAPTFNHFNQGSHDLATGVEPLLGEDYDIDVGIIFKITYSVSCRQEGKGEIVFLNLAISDSIERDKYENLVLDTCSIYQISIPEPSPHFLKSKRQLEIFSYEYRKLLNKIQARHGKDCKIYILPAVPVSMAVECGRVLLPTKDPEIYVCEYYANKEGFKTVLQIN